MVLRDITIARLVTASLVALLAADAVGRRAASPSAADVDSSLAGELDLAVRCAVDDEPCECDGARRLSSFGSDAVPLLVEAFPALSDAEASVVLRFHAETIGHVLVDELLDRLEEQRATSATPAPSFLETLARLRVAEAVPLASEVLHDDAVPGWARAEALLLLGLVANAPADESILAWLDDMAWKEVTWAAQPRIPEGVLAWAMKPGEARRVLRKVPAPWGMPADVRDALRERQDRLSLAASSHVVEIGGETWLLWAETWRMRRSWWMSRWAGSDWEEHLYVGRFRPPRLVRDDVPRRVRVRADGRVEVSWPRPEWSDAEALAGCNEKFAEDPENLERCREAHLSRLSRLRVTADFLERKGRWPAPRVIAVEELRRDRDGDGLTDRLETALGLRLDRRDSDRDGIDDARDPIHLWPGWTPRARDVHEVADQLRRLGHLRSRHGWGVTLVERGWGWGLAEACAEAVESTERALFGGGELAGWAELTPEPPEDFTDEEREWFGVGRDELVWTLDDGVHTSCISTSAVILRRLDGRLVVREVVPLMIAQYG